MAKILCLHVQSELDFHDGIQALFLALKCIEVSNYTKYVVHSDSFSCLQAFAGLKTDHPFMAEVIYKLTNWQQLDVASNCTGCLAMLASDEANKLIGAAKKYLNYDVEACLI